MYHCSALHISFEYVFNSLFYLNTTVFNLTFAIRFDGDVVDEYHLDEATHYVTRDKVCLILSLFSKTFKADFVLCWVAAFT